MWHSLPVPLRALPNPLEQVSLTRLLNVAGLIALTVTGPVIIAPPVVALLLDGSTGAAAWVTLTVPLALWLSGFTPALAMRRAEIQTLAGLLVITLFLLLPSLPWIPVVISGFAVVVGAVFTLPTRAVIAVIVVVSGITIAYDLTHVSPFTSPAASVWAVVGDVVVTVGAGGGLLIAWRSWQFRVREAEREYAEVQRIAEARQRDDARIAATAAATRRIHETVLNTLTAISLGVSPAQIDQARAACHRDLEQAAFGLDLLPDSPLSTILAEAARVVGTVTVRLDLSADNDVIVPSSIANPLRDAVVEALRNVDRHAGVQEAHIDVRPGVPLMITITDDGVGLPSDAEERFGLRNAIRSSMATIGGAASAERREAGGTKVTLHVPLEAPREHTPLTLRTLRIVDSSPLARLGLISTCLYMLVLLAPVASSLPRPGFVVAFTLGYIATVTVLALLWSRVPRTTTTWLALALLVATFLAAASSLPTCEDVWPVLVLITGMTGGAALLPLLALDTWPSRTAAVIVVALSSVTVIIAMPSECTAVLWIQWAVTTAYLSAFAIGLTWVETVFERQRDRAQVQWNEVLAAEVADEARLAAASTWGELGVGARDLLEGITEGSVDLRSPDVSARAAAEADSLRASLGLTSAPVGAVAALSRRLVRAAAQSGGTFEVELLTEFPRSDPYPDEVAVILESLLGPDGTGHLVIRGFVDDGFEELVVVVPRRNVGGMAAMTLGDTTVQTIVGDSEAHVLVRRPSTRRVPSG